jgi:hypothetical protein
VAQVAATKHDDDLLDQQRPKNGVPIELASLASPMMLDAAARQMHRDERPRGQDAAAPALVGTPSRGFGAFDLDRISSPTLPFPFSMSMKFNRVHGHCGILGWSWAHQCRLVSSSIETKIKTPIARVAYTVLVSTSARKIELIIIVASWTPVRDGGNSIEMGVGQPTYEGAIDYIYILCALPGEEQDHASMGDIDCDVFIKMKR